MVDVMQRRMTAQRVMVDSGREEQAFAQQVEAGTAVHLPFQQFDPIDSSLSGSGTPVEGETGGDRVQIGTEAGRPPACWAETVICTSSLWQSTCSTRTPAR